MPARHHVNKGRKYVRQGSTKPRVEADTPDADTDVSMHSGVEEIVSPKTNKKGAGKASTTTVANRGISANVVPKTEESFLGKSLSAGRTRSGTVDTCNSAGGIVARATNNGRRARLDSDDKQDAFEAESDSDVSMHSALPEFVDQQPQTKLDPKSSGSGTVCGEMAVGSNIRVAKPRGSNVLGAAIASHKVPEDIISTKQATSSSAIGPARTPPRRSNFFGTASFPELEIVIPPRGINKREYQRFPAVDAEVRAQWC